MRITRRGIRVVVAGIWILDGLLQLQSSMFTSTFGTQVLAPAGQGQPWFVSEPVALTARIVAAHPLPWDALFAAIQIGLGIGFLIPRLVRPALAASVVWALSVWWLGEGLGGLASGHADIVTGAPGAVLLYAVLAIATWPEYDPAGRERADFPRWLPVAWAVFWIGGALLWLLPGQGTSRAIGDEISSAGEGGPGWLAGLDHSVARSVGSLGFGLVGGLFLLCLAIGLAGFIEGRIRTVAACAGIVLALAVWIFGEGAGQPWTGTATDPNSGPLIVLIALGLIAVAKSAPVRGRHRRTHSRAGTWTKPANTDQWRKVPAHSAA
jgi:hypothetical protein